MVLLSDAKKFGNISELTSFVGEKISSLPYETACAAFLDKQNNLISLVRLSSGISYTVEYDVKSLIEYASAISCKRVVLYHNHPSGSSEPSEGDIVATKMLYKLMYINGMDLIDHIVISREGYQSVFEFAPEITL